MSRVSNPFRSLPRVEEYIFVQLSYYDNANTGDKYDI